MTDFLLYMILWWAVVVIGGYIIKNYIITTRDYDRLDLGADGVIALVATSLHFYSLMPDSVDWIIFVFVVIAVDLSAEIVRKDGW